MPIIRSGGFYIAIALLAILYAPPCILSRLVSRDISYGIAKHWVKCTLALLRLFCGLEYRISGDIYQQPAIYVCNHQSAWECIALMHILPQVCFVLKRELLWIPFFGWGLAAIGAIAIDRSKKTTALRKIIAQTKENLKQGSSVLLFPEGTRHPPGECGEMQRSYALLAAECDGYPVIPVAHNSGWFWPRRSLTKKSGCIDIKFGQAITTEGKKTSQIATEVETWVKQQVASLPRP